MRLVAKKGGDEEGLSEELNDLLICIEMPSFAIAHNYAFSYRDFLDDSRHSFAARMPMVYAAPSRPDEERA